ncbi:MAG TPA: PepSY-associated TM helix domain-containing protein [Bryobacteraceae bacterium]
MTDTHPTVWRRWLRQPQKIWLRRALFQVHLWSGIAVGLYVFMISVTGSVLIYRNELYSAATRQLSIAKGSGPLLTDAQIAAAAIHLYPDYRVERIIRLLNTEQGVDIWLRRGSTVKKRLFDPWTGHDLGDSVPFGIWAVSKMLDLHDNLLAGQTGREVNGLGAAAVLLLAMTGLVIWWPGSKTWARSLRLPRGVGWKRGTWHLHSMIGIWSLAFTVMFGFSGLYLAFPDVVQNIADWIEPPTPANAGLRIGDRVIYWLAYLHFGRICGIAIPCRGPGFCDQSYKAIWALFGVAPAVMFVTGAIMWWNRVLRPRSRAPRPTARPATAS